MAETEVVFAATVEGLFKRALGSKLSAAAVEQIRGSGIDLSRPLLPAYPREVFYASLRIAAADVYKDLPGDEAFRRLGLDFMRGWEETLMGRALLGVIRLLGPKRTLERMRHNFHNANNYMEATLRQCGADDYELVLSQTSGVPTYFQGVLQFGLDAAGAKHLRVEVSGREGAAATYRVRWGQAFATQASAPPKP